MTKFKKSQIGQTLIETIVAIFILVTAISAGLSMSIYALNSSINSKNYTIAINLAREGADAARMMRDTNWLALGAAGTPPPCADIGNRLCWVSWITGPRYDFNPNNQPHNDRERFMFNPATRTWTIDRRNGGENYFLCLQPDGTYQHNRNGGLNCSSSNFARRVRVSTRSGSAIGFTFENPELVIQSIVQWEGKNCPVIPANINETPGRCKVVVEERLSNWKDYR